ncbi:MAG: C10 family peptidase [Prevotellaceae bacterium]|nr:C10 family peptidase [Prevotellaceae bacterium]
MIKRFLVFVFAFVFVFVHSAYAGINKAEMEVAYKATTAGNVDFTVYNKTGNKGFVVLDNHDQVLGYSDQGSFDYDKIPDNMKWWLSQYQDQINWARTNHIKTAPIKSDDSNDSIIVSPLLGDIAWSQGSPYNKMCPTVGGQRCIVGCTATAMSQIMLYYKWPIKGRGYHEYDWNGKTLSCNFNESTYDWDNILPSYLNSYSDEQADAVAKLCSDAGISVDMTYGVNLSTAIVDKQYNAFPRYFSYSRNIKYCKRYDFTEAEWDSMLRAELDAARPVFYSGRDINSGGHAFVCDGYTKSGYFHFNWGWNGTYNSFFKIGALNVSEYQFNLSNEITIGIEPRKTTLIDGLCYEFLADSTVTLTYKDDAEYKESVTIPEKIAYNGKIYRVSKLTEGFLPEINCVPSLQVPWTTPLEISKNVFSDSVYHNTTLIVPDNCIEAYVNNPIWNKFRCIKDTIGHVLEWGDWKPVGEGTGTYTYSANYLVTLGGYPANDPDLPVSYRPCLSDEGKGQFWIQHWSRNTDLFINYDINTGNCTIPKQYAGFDINYTLNYKQKTAGTYVSDIPTFYPKSTYEDFPCTYDSDKGLFTLNLVYAYGDESKMFPQTGVETFVIEGFSFNFGDANKDRVINVNDITAIASFILDSKTKPFNRFSADVNNDGVINANDIAEIAKMILEK